MLIHSVIKHLCNVVKLGDADVENKTHICKVNVFGTYSSMINLA